MVTNLSLGQAFLYCNHIFHRLLSFFLTYLLTFLLTYLLTYLLTFFLSFFLVAPFCTSR